MGKCQICFKAEGNNYEIPHTILWELSKGIRRELTWRTTARVCEQCRDAISESIRKTVQEKIEMGKKKG